MVTGTWGGPHGGSRGCGNHASTLSWRYGMPYQTNNAVKSGRCSSCSRLMRARLSSRDGSRHGTPIEGVLRAWALEVAGGARTRPHRGREQTTEVRDAVISNTVQTLTQCGLSKTRNEASPPRSACDAVGEVLTMRYEAVVKACGRAAAA